MIKEIVDQIVQFGTPAEMREISKELCPKGLTCGAADCTFTHPKLPGIVPQAEASATCRFFVIRSVTVEKLHTALNQGVWATNKTNTVVFQEAFEKNDHVIFLFCAED